MQDDRAAVGDQRRVVGEDGVGVVDQGRVMVDNFDAVAEQRIDKGVVLLLGQWQIRLVGVMPARRVSRAEGRIGPPHQHRLQRREHRLAAVVGHGGEGERD